MTKLPPAFYQQKNVLLIAKELLGKILVTRFNGIETAGRIAEVEAYNGIIDKASHAFGGRRTQRTEVMYTEGGVAYIYLCYGIHHLFNVVTNVKDMPHAVLIRALEPLNGIPAMLKRAGKIKADYTLTKGPGNVSKALGLTTAITGQPLHGKQLFIADDGYTFPNSHLIVSARIGVDYAGTDALLPYRFYIKGNKYVSGKNKQ
jgi:DNA-3-methyladenine glycosylase